VIQLILIFSVGLILIISSTFLFYRFGWKSIFLLLFPLLLIFFLTSENNSEVFPLILGFFLTGFIAGYSLRNRKSIQFFLLFSSLTLTVLFSGNYYFLKIHKGIEILGRSKEGIIEIINSSNFSVSERREFTAQLDESLDILRDIIPFAYFINSIIFSLLFFYFARVILKKFLKNHEKEAHGIEFFKLNDYFIFTLILGWLIVLLVDKREYYIIYISGLNIALIISVLYLIQSIGIFKFFLKKKGLPQFLIPLSVLVILFLGLKIVLFLSIILVGIGAIDFWADFRKIGNAGKTPS
jgi:uncharacterized protein YybS (DUF2232 family)